MPENKKPTEVGGCGAKALGAQDAVFTLLFGFVQRFIDAHHQFIQRLHVPFPSPALKVTVRPSSRRAPFDVYPPCFQQRAGVINMFGRKDHRELFTTIAIEGYLQRLEDLQPFAGDVTQNDIAVEVTRCR